MLHRRPPGPAALLMLMLMLMLPLSAARSDDDCARAEQWFEQARTAAAPTARVALLTQAVQRCPTFSGWYALGRAHLDAETPQPALAAFEQARSLADAPSREGLALGRLAEAHRALGQTGEALAVLEAAFARYAATDPPQPPPEWLTALRRQLDLASADTILPASVLRATLDGSLRTRGIIVVPRVRLHILFAYDSATLAAEGTAQIGELAQALAGLVEPRQRVRLIGHTDVRGSDEHNQQLSTARARSVAAALAERLPALAGRIDTEGHGKHEPLYPGTDEESHRLNRRVVVELVSGD